MMQLPKSKILIVDDNTTNIKLVEGFLRHDGHYDYLSTTVPGEVEGLCATQGVDMVLLDIMMPDMDGYQVCEVLKQNPATRNIPVIFLTAKHGQENIVRGFNAGGVDYLTKPINAMELLARMSTHLRLRRQEQELIELNATKDRFIAIIAEDLRSPITGLHGVLQMVDNNFDQLSTDHLHEYLSMAHLAAEGLDSLATNLIRWSSLHHSELPLRPVELDLHLLFVDTIRQVQEESPQKKLHFEIGIAKGSFISIDETSLREVALNLLRNALAFSHHHGVVNINARRDDGHWEITIRDRGIGIDSDNLKKLFRLDQRFTRIGTDGEMGSGMGLLLCQELLARNGGTIVIASELNQGTEATITLPATQR